MGCDIHPHIQFVHRPGLDGHKEFLDSWTVVLSRDYQLFALMAGVRGDLEPVSEPRGLPEQISWEIDEEAFEYAGGEKRPEPDWHTYSWLTLDELYEVRRRYLSLTPKIYRAEDELAMLIAAMEEMAKQGRGPKLVFWFDN
jgi:hypothetical protein